MLSKEILSAHYQEYASQPDEWVENMEATKRSIVEEVLRYVGYKSSDAIVKVLVLGASDKRYIRIHKRVFEKATNSKIEMTTLDIDADHLGGASKEIVCHDVTKPFPNTPYDFVFSHELMKFLTHTEQLQTIKNSYQALGKNGVAMHIMHEPSIKGTSELKPWQYRFDPDLLIDQLKINGIPAEKIVFNSDSDVEWLRETTVIILRK